MELIEQIGSYAGLAAIIGLAVLSALYFSQARDVRRLREAEEARPGGAAAPQPARPRPPARVAAVPAGKRPEPQATGVTRVAPAAPATAAGDSAAPGAVGQPAAGAQTAGGEASGAAPSKPAEAPAAPGGASPVPPRQGAPAQGGNAGGRPAPRPLPARPPGPPPGAAALRLGQASAARRARWYRRLEPRYLALIAAGALVLGIGGVVGVSTLAGDDATTQGEASGGAERSDAAPLDPSTITVSVLNGTAVEGAADQVASTVEAAGYQRGNVDNAAEPSAESVVLFAEGARPAARQVGRELDITQLELIDSDTESLAGTADVAVVVGADRAQ